MSTFGVIFNDVTVGPVGKLVLPAPHRTGNIKVDVIVNMNHITFRSIGRSIDLRSFGVCEYTDHDGNIITIKHEINEWNDLKITIEG